MKVLIAGGGTGGHINPALAIASIIKGNEPDAEFLFVGTPNGMEAKLIPDAGYNFAPIKVKGFQRKITIQNIKRNCEAVLCLFSSDKRAGEIIKDFKPDIAIGTGGYVSGPIIRKAARMGIPTAIHEANAYPGVTTKLLSKEVDKVMLTVEEAVKYMDKDIDYIVTGLPVREGINKITREQARKQLNFDDGMCILSFGGSLGAGCINETMSDVIEWHTKNGLAINHIHGYGGMGKDSFPRAMADKKINLESKRLRISEYINDMDVCLAAADLVICRAGASTLAELEAMGRASILIPSPIVSGNHQLHNANVLGKAGAAIVIEQKNVTSEDMINKVKELYYNREKLKSMSQKAGELAIRDTKERIYEVIGELVNSKK
ncbi:MAG: undecaprenyldiphospho-muramoylpentapeptide beta-N-acetylglucosaminyltransferase [Clostridiales bacterium]|nr:undecaprenyldiphospho-muramoylpentapeptide beta-N-acetylglucosaminyltransferase [Clostridiales bacterium]